jgi:hypothetical protein
VLCKAYIVARIRSRQLIERKAEGMTADVCWERPAPTKSWRRYVVVGAVTLLAALAVLSSTASASGRGPVGLPPLPGQWRLTGSRHTGIGALFEAKHGGFVLSRSGRQRYAVSHLHLLLPGTLPKDSPCWRNTQLRVVGTYPATRDRNGEYVLWEVDRPARFVVDGEEMPGHLDMTFQRGIPGGYYRGENHPVMMEVTVPIGQGLECAYGSAGQPRLTESKARTASSSTLKEECVQAGLIQPQVEYAEMTSPGKPGQTVNVSINYSAMMPEGCHGLFRRIGQFQIQLQDATNHRRWFTIYSWNEGGYYTSDEAGNGFKESTRTAIAQKWGKYQCTPGPWKTLVRLQLRNQVKDLTNDHIVRQKIFKVPVVVHGAC